MTKYVVRFEWEGGDSVVLHLAGTPGACLRFVASVIVDANLKTIEIEKVKGTEEKCQE